jgi:hypothetical protein
MRTPLRLISFLLGITVTLAACSAEATGDASERDASGNVVEGGDVGAFRLRVGDCIASASSAVGDAVASVPVVPCDQAHESQIYAAFDIAGDEFPGLVIVGQEAEEGCVDSFLRTFATRDDIAEWELSFLHPTQDTWDQVNDREVLCLAFLPGQSLTFDALSS